MASELDEKASLLGRMLTHFQISVNEGEPLPLIEFRVRAVHKVAGEFLELVKDADPGTVVHMDTRLGDASSKLLADFYGGGDEAPDTLPDDWNET